MDHFHGLMDPLVLMMKPKTKIRPPASAMTARISPGSENYDAWIRDGDTTHGLIIPG